jgi:hypothetical protein
MDGRARAYPWWILDDHHVANDTVGGRPITVTLCEACNTGMAFDPVIEGRRLTFRLGYIYNGTVAVEDRETGTVWSPYLMVGIRGKLRGTPLTQLPVAQMRWAAWRDLHPNTDVLPAELGSRTGHGSGYTMGRPELGTGMRRTMARWDERFASDSIVLGVVGRNVARVYPFDLLRDHGGVVNDSLDGVPIVALAHQTEGSFAALAFSRLLDGRELTFAAGPDGPVDQETGSRWTFEGRAVAGPLEGAALEFVASSVSAWPAWPAHFPSIEIFVPD